jgi:hypothetical protein
MAEQHIERLTTTLDALCEQHRQMSLQLAELLARK